MSGYSEEVRVERRAVNKLCSYWRELLEEAKQDNKTTNCPKYEQVNRDDIIEIWPYCFIIKVIREKEGENFLCQYIGDKAKENISNLRENNLIEHLEDSLDELLRSKELIIDGSDAQNTYGQDIKMRKCLLPLGENGQINFILGAITCKVD